MATSTNSTVSQLRSQWSNPTDVLSVLLIIGGDIVQKALAQTAGGIITPVCFSFGWVAYSFSTLVGVIGDGRLLPPPDYPVKVFNLGSSYCRENRNWIIGRLLRDNEVYMNSQLPLNGSGLRISIYSALPASSNTKSVRTNALWAVATLMQIVIASIPWAIDNEWGVFLITSSGILAAIVAGGLPQWRVEKLPLKRRSAKYVALTSGNGSRDIMIVYGAKVALDLEELAAAESPRSGRVWEALSVFSRPGLPVGLWVTRLACFVQTVFWLALLIVVAGLKSHSWYLVAVGALGMLQNAMVAAVSRSPDRRDLPLRLVDKFKTHRTMDGLMDLEATINGAGHVLREEFFPGMLREDELNWWKGAAI
ncbi:hypothetical protein K505DRAFT_349649 [Melanomma pulvis-pyrius CBS 109.77]|uniref:Uncharacterized protein n=1 Tax=Melanomma pulvis-pyrius CBS 109.77 TaxID=1314802 RepID=A0A6A6XCI7_9PLEO|nr:hypothetical protein K505DRAFT_349649 [Melanomma pulvis-pyrius CBS 109.77]